jgi:hypothetical protein
MARKTKYVLMMGDTHCGHKAGLTPLHFQQVPDLTDYEGEQAEERLQKIHNKGVELQRQGWAWFTKEVKSLPKLDAAHFNGDLIDGPGGRSGGVELLSTDCGVQADMATHICKHVRAGYKSICYGTAYHTGLAEDWELQVANRCNAEIKSHHFLKVNGVTFDLKHHLGSSSVPHGRHTAIAKDRLWNVLWSEGGRQPEAQIYIRSHVHYHQFAGGTNWLGMTLPALQAAHTKYGARRCNGLVDYGFVLFIIKPSGAYEWGARLCRMEAEKARASVV